MQRRLTLTLLFIITLLLCGCPSPPPPIPPPPPPPTGNTVVLQWTDADAGVKFNVYRGTTRGLEGATPINALLLTVKTYTDKVPAGTYYYRIGGITTNTKYPTIPLSNEEGVTFNAQATNCNTPVCTGTTATLRFRLGTGQK